MQPAFDPQVAMVRLLTLESRMEGIAKLVETSKRKVVDDVKEAEPPIKRSKWPSDEEMQKARDQDVGEFLRTSDDTTVDWFFKYQKLITPEKLKAEKLPLVISMPTPDVCQAAFQTLVSILPIEYCGSYEIGTNTSKLTVDVTELMRQNTVGLLENAGNRGDHSMSSSSSSSDGVASQSTSNK